MVIADITGRDMYYRGNGDDRVEEDRIIVPDNNCTTSTRSEFHSIAKLSNIEKLMHVSCANTIYLSYFTHYPINDHPSHL